MKWVAPGKGTLGAVGFATRLEEAPDQRGNSDIAARGLDSPMVFMKAGGA
jgi:hypothetical protein